MRKHTYKNLDTYIFFKKNIDDESIIHTYIQYIHTYHSFITYIRFLISSTYTFFCMYDFRGGM